MNIQKNFKKKSYSSVQNNITNTDMQFFPSHNTLFLLRRPDNRHTALLLLYEFRAYVAVFFLLACNPEYQFFFRRATNNKKKELFKGKPLNEKKNYIFLTLRARAHLKRASKILDWASGANHAPASLLYIWEQRINALYVFHTYDTVLNGAYVKHFFRIKITVLAVCV